MKNAICTFRMTEGNVDTSGHEGMLVVMDEGVQSDCWRHGGETETAWVKSCIVSSFPWLTTNLFIAKLAGSLVRM